MIKGPLFYTAIVLAAILMAFSMILMLFRNVFVDNMELVTIVSGLLALGVVAVLVVMLLRMKKQQ